VTDRRTTDATLISALRILARDIQSGDGVANACLLEAAMRLEELVEARRWIPVGERLPEVGTDVLAMGGEGVFQACLILWGESRRWEALVLDVHGCGCCGGGGASVTHWQPLPPGPETKEVPCD
jgi:hypothetical protein